MIGLFRIKGHSMEPEINSGEIFIVAKIEPRAGDVVVFENEGINLAKRIKKIEGDNYILKGDNEGHSKEYQIGKEQIVGKLAFKLWPVF